MGRSEEISRAQFGRLAQLICLCMAILTVSNIHGQTAPHSCESLPHVVVPEGDRPTIADLELDVLIQSGGRRPSAALATTACQGFDLYYSELPKHFERARWCVLAKLGLFSKVVNPSDAQAAQTAVGGDFNDPSGISGSDDLTLAMIYANGEGVQRNLPLARQFVCQDSDLIAAGPPDELLARFDKMVENGGRFDICSDGGEDFGRSVNFNCLNLQDGKVIGQTRKLEHSILASGSPAQRAAFVALTGAHSDFGIAYSELSAQICDGGTGCGPIQEADSLAIDRPWLAALAAVQAGSPPCSAIDASAFAPLDAELNRQYKEALSEAAEGDPGKSIAPLIRGADRTWLAYREAWVRFGQLRWPAVPANQWRAWQTKEWIDLLGRTR